MNFPVSNKEESYIRVLAIVLLIICATWLFYTILHDLLIFYISGVLLIFTFFPSLFYIRKQNVRSLRLDNNTLTVCHNEESIQIHIDKIKKVYSGIGGIDLRLNMSKRYVILLNTEYPFGNKLRITYRDSNPSRSFLEEDPHEVKVLKHEIMNLEK
jgi:Ca2+/Na+ antiporter